MFILVVAARSVARNAVPCVRSFKIALSILYQIGYSTTSPLLSDKARFPLFFRTSPSETLTNPAIVAVLQVFGWKRIAIIVENGNIFSQVLCFFTFFTFFFSDCNHSIMFFIRNHLVGQNVT